MMDAQGGKYLTFSLDKEDYGIPIHKVREIIGMMEITAVPRSPKFIKGVINLRGKIIPLMDLRLKFDLEAKGYNERTCIIVVEVALEKGFRLMGVVVDTVSEVVNIQPGDIEPPPQYGSQIDVSFLTGMGKVKGRVVMLLEIQRVLDTEEMSMLKNIKEG